MQEIIKKANQGDKAAQEEIIKKFMPLIYKASHKVYIAGYEEEDLIQIGAESILKAVQKFDSNKNTSFTAYVKNTVENNYKYLVRGKVKENYVKSLNELQEDGFELEDHIPMDFNLENYVVNSELKKKLREAIESLTPEEKELLHYAFYKDHGGLTEYAKAKSMDYNKVYKLKNSLINKLREYIV